MELKVLVTALLSKLFKKTDGISASVKTNESIVPRFGAIIPDPFAIAEILISLFQTLHVSKANFGLVSVVIIDEAALNQINLFCFSLNFSTNSGKFSLIFCVGYLSPITPVEAKIISFGLIACVVPCFF